MVIFLSAAPGVVFSGTERGAKGTVGPGAISPVGELVTAAASEAYVRTPDGLEVQVFENSRMGLSDLRDKPDPLREGRK